MARRRWKVKIGTKAFRDRVRRAMGVEKVSRFNVPPLENDDDDGSSEDGDSTPLSRFHTQPLPRPLHHTKCIFSPPPPLPEEIDAVLRRPPSPRRALPPLLPPPPPPPPPPQRSAAHRVWEDHIQAVTPLRLQAAAVLQRRAGQRRDRPRRAASSAMGMAPPVTASRQQWRPDAATRAKERAVKAAAAVAPTVGLRRVSEEVAPWDVSRAMLRRQQRLQRRARRSTPDGVLKMEMEEASFNAAMVSAAAARRVCSFSYARRRGGEGGAPQRQHRGRQQQRPRARAPRAATALAWLPAPAVATRGSGGGVRATHPSTRRARATARPPASAHGVALASAASASGSASRPRSVVVETSFIDLSAALALEEMVQTTRRRGPVLHTAWEAEEAQATQRARTPMRTRAARRRSASESGENQAPITLAATVVKGTRRGKPLLRSATSRRQPLSPMQRCSPQQRVAAVCAARRVEDGVRTVPVFTMSLV